MKLAEFLQPCRRESRRLCGELAWLGRRKPATAGRLLARASVGFLARKSKPAVAGKPFRRSPQRKDFAGPAAFPRRLARFSKGRESDSALRQGLPGGTTEVSSHEPGLVSPKAGATERRKVWRNFV